MTVLLVVLTAPMIVAEDTGAASSVDAEVGRLLKRLNQQQTNGQACTDPWAKTMRAMIELGPDAVPELIAALEQPPDEERYMLRSLPFILQGIGDPRAVPSLVQTLVKCN